jgi:hypothetical protein
MDGRACGGDDADEQGLVIAASAVGGNRRVEVPQTATFERDDVPGQRRLDHSTVALLERP